MQQRGNCKTINKKKNYSINVYRFRSNHFATSFYNWQHQRKFRLINNSFDCVGCAIVIVLFPSESFIQQMSSQSRWCLFDQIEVVWRLEEKLKQQRKKNKKNIKQQLKFHFGRAGKKKRTNTEKKGLERSRSLAMNIIVLFVVNTVLEGVRRIADKLQQHHHHHQYQRIIRTATRRIRFNLSPLGKSKKRRKVLLLHFPLDVRYKPHKFFLFILSMLR